jgi:hypothetical protein
LLRKREDDPFLLVFFWGGGLFCQACGAGIIKCEWLKPDNCEGLSQRLSVFGRKLSTSRRSLEAPEAAMAWHSHCPPQPAARSPQPPTTTPLVESPRLTTNRTETYSSLFAIAGQSHRTLGFDRYTALADDSILNAVFGAVGAVAEIVRIA